MQPGQLLAQPVDLVPQARRQARGIQGVDGGAQRGQPGGHRGEDGSGVELANRAVQPFQLGGDVVQDPPDGAVEGPVTFAKRLDDAVFDVQGLQDGQGRPDGELALLRQSVGVHRLQLRP